MSIHDAQTFAIPSDPETRDKIARVFKDMSHQLVKCEAMKDYVKEAKKNLKEEYEIPASVINRMFQIYHKDNAKTYFEEQKDMEALYDALFESGDNNE